MKTSTIILISLFSIVGIFLLSLLIQVEGKPNRQLTNNLNVESHALHKF